MTPGLAATPERDDWLLDLALLAALSVAVHALLGLYGLAGALLLFAGLEHGPPLLSARSSGACDALSAPHKSPISASTATSEASDTDAEDEVPDEAADETEPPVDAEQLRRARRRLARLVVRDVGRSLSPPSRSQPQEPHESQHVEMNACTPVHFETALFEGEALFLVRSSPEDPRHVALLAGKRRLFWIQVQGRFKRAPRGAVFLGGELPAAISPGVFTRSLARVILGLVRRLVGHVIFSFGSNTTSNKSVELPAVAFPLFQCVDQFVETPAGCTPPTLGSSDFGESEDARRRRRRTPLGQERYVVGHTYSFHFHTMYVDLTRWETANLPGGLNAVDLASFFDSLPLRLVAYDVVPAPDNSDKHLQSLKDYLFAFEVRYDKHRCLQEEEEEDVTVPLERHDRSEMPGINGGGLLGSEMSTMSSTLSDTSLVDEDGALARQQAAFLRRESARRLAQISFSLLCWLEELDVASDMRRVHYVFVVRDKEDEDDSEPEAQPRRQRLAIVSSYTLRGLLQRRHAHSRGKAAQELAQLRFHSRSRIGSYSTISTETQQVAAQLQQLAAEPLPPAVYGSLDGSDSDDDAPAEDEESRRAMAAQAALYRCLSARQRLQETCTTSVTLSPSRLGVNLSQREREDLGVVCQGVVYRYYTAGLLRQEVLLLTTDTLLFFRSYASSAEKHLSCAHILGVRAVELPCGATDGAFALQISSFAEELVLCVGTAFARDAWVRAVSQQSDPAANLARAQRGELDVCFSVSTALRPANRLELNSRSLFPQLQLENDAKDAIDTSSVSGALQLVKRTLERALGILNEPTKLSVTQVLAFLDDASALRAVDLQLLQDAGSHEQQLAFFLNLYHVVLAHAMLAHGFPRGRGQWPSFLSRMSYALSRGSEHQQLSLSLAEIEHLVLRARLPRAQLPHLKLSNVLAAASPLLAGLGLSHPDFRLSLALVTNHSGSDVVTLFEPERVHEQLNAVLRAELRRWVAQGSLQVRANAEVVLPRFCEWYRRDFSGLQEQEDGDAALTCLRKLLGFLDEPVQQQVLSLLAQDAPLRASFRTFKYTPKTTLTVASNES